jgi:DNA invertase Pin-like site-specific DNA recombinase
MGELSMARYGYARVSTRDQNPLSQEDALREAGCERVFTDKRSGRLASRPGLDECLAALQPGDTLVITRLSRMARSVRNLLDITEQFRERNITLIVLKQQIDTSTPQGRLVFHVLAAIDEFQREIIAETTEEGLASAKARGRTPGRKPGLDKRKVAIARQLADSGETIAEIARVLNVSRPTVYRHLEASRKQADA